MERQIPPARLLGVLVVRRLLFIWFRLLQYRASKWVNPMASGLPVELSSRREFLSKNLELQEGLRQVFAPFYHLCGLCGPECCCCFFEGILYGPPHRAVDSVLYGIYPDSVRSLSPLALSEELNSVFWWQADLISRYFKQYILGKMDDPQGEEELQEPLFPCPAWTERGCGLPWGRRPAYCVFYACGRFLREMDFREGWRYVWLSGRYFLHLTLSLKLVVAEWRHQQGMYSSRTKAGETIEGSYF